MKTVNLYQFNGDPRVPRPWRQCLLEIYEFCNTAVRPFYREAAEAAIGRARDKGLDTIVELGAGHGPLTRLMVEDPRAEGLRFVVCDLIPAVDQYQELERRYPGKVTAITESVDFSRPREWGRGALLLLCAAIHHVPDEARSEVIRAMSVSAGGVMVFVPVRKTWLSLVLSLLIVFPALALPIGFIKRPGTLRRILWCWLLPVVPLMAGWDALGGVLRQWSDVQWRCAIAEQTGGNRKPEINNGLNQQMIAW